VVNANSVLLFNTTPPSKESDYLTPEKLSSRLDEMRNTLCPITYEPIPLRNAMISNVGNPPPHSPIPPILLQNPTSDTDFPIRAGVFPSCGHVFQLPPPNLNSRLLNCPKCRVAGRMIPLLLQTAPTLLRVQEEFTHVLPCGHAVSEELGKRMGSVGLPSNDLLVGETEAKMWGICLTGRRRRCWFCGTGFYPSEMKKLYFERE
jgi:hypothetical protein